MSIDISANMASHDRDCGSKEQSQSVDVREGGDNAVNRV